jgi:hypothetical protein
MTDRWVRLVKLVMCQLYCNERVDVAMSRIRVVWCRKDDHSQYVQ